MKVSQALALFDDREFVAPEHVQEAAGPVIAHRLVIDPQAGFSGLTARTVAQEILRRISVPA